MKKQTFYQLCGSLLLIGGIVPLLSKAFNAGSIALILGGIILLTTPKWSEKWRKRFMPLFVFGLVCALLFSGTLLYYARFRGAPAELQGETVIVLGCKVNGDLPSQMLRRRLDAAVRYLDTNPDARCIVSGGQGSNEQRSEASVMADYLIAQGIDSSRIYGEEHSTDTKENLQFSMAIIEEQKLSPETVIISDGFHQFRARLIAQKLGLQSWAYTGQSNPWLVPSYVVREVLSLIKLIPFFLS